MTIDVTDGRDARLAREDARIRAPPSARVNTAGALAIAAGVYELTPLKRQSRRRCPGTVRSGLEYGLEYVGSSIRLMLLALGVMSIAWMSMVAVLMLGQKLLPSRASIDVPLAIAMVALGILVVLAPSAVPI